MKTFFTSVRFYLLVPLLVIIIGLPKNSFAFEKKAIAPSITLSTEPLANGVIGQQVTNKPMYIVKIVTGAEQFVISRIKTKTIGTYTNNDVEFLRIYSDATPNATIFSNSSYVTGIEESQPYGAQTTAFNVNKVIPANTTIYYYICPGTRFNTTAGNKIKMNGSATPFVIESDDLTATVTINQTDVGAELTFAVANLLIETNAIGSTNINPNSGGSVYQLKVTNSGFVPASIRGAQVVLDGTFDSNDLSSIAIPSVGISSGPVLNNSIINAFGGSLTVPSNTAISIIISVSSSSSPAATIGNTIKFKNIVLFYNDTPTVTYSLSPPQNVVTIGTPMLTLATEPTIAQNVSRNDINVPIYMLKVQAGAVGGAITQVTTLTSGTYMSSDVSNLKLYSNNVASFTGATLLKTDNTITGNFETAVFNLLDVYIPNNTSKYFLVTADITAAATFGRTIKVIGASPSNVIQIYTNGVNPVITNSQTDLAGLQTIGEAFFQLEGSMTAANIATAAYVSLVKGGIIQKTSAVVNNTYNLGNVFDGTYDVVLHNNPLGWFVPILPVGFSAFAGESLNGGPNDAIADGKYSIILTGDNLAPARKMALQTINFTLTATPLPLSLISFSATAKEIGNELVWKTTSESDFSHFEVQKSADGKEFSIIEKVSGGKSFYSTLDENPLDGNNYYRLKMVDLDGNSRLSKIINVRNEGNFLVTISPNPAQDILQIEGQNIISIRLLNSMGQIMIEKQNSGNSKIQLPVNNISDGHYFLQINSLKEMAIYKKVVIMH